MAQVEADGKDKKGKNKKKEKEEPDKEPKEKDQHEVAVVDPTQAWDMWPLLTERTQWPLLSTDRTALRTGWLVGGVSKISRQHARGELRADTEEEKRQQCRTRAAGKGFASGSNNNLPVKRKVLPPPRRAG